VWRTCPRLAQNGQSVRRYNGDLQDRLAAGHGNGGARDITRQRISQHDLGRRQLRRLARALHWNFLAAFTASSVIVEGIRGVQIGPGATALARMPFSARSWARPAVKFWIAPFGWLRNKSSRSASRLVSRTFNRYPVIHTWSYKLADAA
jgi:hypothetical protein